MNFARSVISCAASICLMFVCPLLEASVSASPEEEFPKWAAQEESHLAAHFKLPKDFDPKSSADLKVVVQFHVTAAGLANNFKLVRSDPSTLFSKVTIPEKQFEELESALFDAVRKSEPLLPVPESFHKRGAGVKLCYSPNSSKKFEVVVIAEARSKY